MDVPSERRCVAFSSPVEPGILGPRPSIKDHTGNQTLLQNNYHSYYHYGTNYPIFTSHSRLDHRWWLSRRISDDSFGMLNSWPRTTNPLPYNAPPLVLGSSRTYGPEGIEATDVVGDPLMSITRRKSPLCGELFTSADVSVVAVLVCGHLHHADCLEGKTSEAHKRDSRCPLCS
ncbi:unnamed protein product [Victoria cruziana]